MSSIKVSLGSREIVQYLRILTALCEDQGLVPSTHIVAYVCNCSFRGSDALFWLLPALACTYAHKLMQLVNS